MNITDYSLSLTNDNNTITLTLKYYGNENITIIKKNCNEEMFIKVPRMVLQKFMEMIDET